jgi:hypothetical protein
MTTQLALHACPLCGYRVDRAAAVEKRPGREPQPKPGDWSICIKCGSGVVFTQELGLRPPTAPELAEMAADQTMQAAQHAWRDTFDRNRRQ